MRALLLPPTIHPYPCRYCGETVRSVIMTDGSLATINEKPSPAGDIVPWPNDSPNGVAMGRRLTVPVSDGPMWAEHSCR